MASLTQDPKSPVRRRLLDAARICLLRDGYSGLATRSIADEAGTQVSQIHYHFGSRLGLVLALLEQQNADLLGRQTRMFGSETPLSVRWQQSCDFLEEDVRSGYVRVLQEIVAGGYSDPKLAAAARSVLRGWFVLLDGLALEAQALFATTQGFAEGDIACLMGLVFLGAETMILIDMDLPVVRSLRAVGFLFATLEARRAREQPNAG